MSNTIIFHEKTNPKCMCKKCRNVWATLFDKRIEASECLHERIETLSHPFLPSKDRCLDCGKDSWEGSGNITVEEFEQRS